MLSLDEAIAVTLTENPALKAAAYEERAAQQQRRAAIGLRMPQINVTGAYAYMAKDIGFDFNDLKGPVKEGVAGGLTALVQNGRSFTGYTHETSPTHHAEQEAIRKALDAGAELRGAAIYSSMEPCSQRKSEPESCTQLILRHGFARVVFALYEPDRFVRCRGAQTLREAGIDVRVYPELAEGVRRANAHLGR